MHLFIFFLAIVHIVTGKLLCPPPFRSKLSGRVCWNVMDSGSLSSTSRAVVLALHHSLGVMQPLVQSCCQHGTQQQGCMHLEKAAVKCPLLCSMHVKSLALCLLQGSPAGAWLHCSRHAEPSMQCLRQGPAEC